MDIKHTLAVIVVAMLCTIFTRAFPFILFGNQRHIPPSVSYLGEMLPKAVMAALLVYCLRQVSFDAPRLLFNQLSCVVITALIHAWKCNTLLSIAVGTGLYMLLSQGILG